MSESPGRVLVFAPTSAGGIAEHVHYQARELARRGFEVTMLCRGDFAKAAAGYRQDRSLLTIRGRHLGAKVGRVAANVVNHYLLALHLLRLRPRFVVMEANSEYQALAWAWPHWLLRLLGTVYVANFHDPVRERRFGPAWLHALSVRLAYAPLSGGLIHGPAPGAGVPPRLAMREAPFGPFEELAGRPPSFDLRQRLAIPRDAFLLLAFGHIVDRKNLDLVILALAEVPEVHLVVAGEAGGSGHKPVRFYRDLARRTGISDRVHLLDGFVADSDIPAYFAAADAVALTYERAFVSQSGVMQIAALWDRPVLASGGDGPLRETVARYGLGQVVEPDSAAAIADGLRRLVVERPDLAGNFARYRATTSWAVNVDRMLEVVAAARV